MRQSDSGGGSNGAKRKVKKAAIGGHGQAPLFRGARHAGLTRRQSQAAFSYVPAPQNWQVILQVNPPSNPPNNSWAYFKAIPRNRSMGFPARFKMPRSERNHAPG
jgi:hypothetical protein